MEDGKNLFIIKVFLRIFAISGKFFCLQAGLDPGKPQVRVSGAAVGWKKGFMAQLSGPTMQTPQHCQALTRGVE